MAKYKRAELTEEEDSVHLDHLKTHVLPVTKKTGLWRRRSLLEKVLLVLTPFLVISLIIALLMLSRSWSNLYTLHIKPQQGQGEYCVSPTCIQAASTILGSMDLKIDPCQDFYHYACGGWIKSNPIPEGKSTWGKFQKLWEKNQLAIKNSLERKVNVTSEAEKKARRFYTSCMDKKGIQNKLGAKPLIDLLVKVGGWSLTPTKFNLSSWSFQTQMQILHNEYNMGGLFTWAVGDDDRNSTRHILQLDQGGLTLPTREYYLNETHKAIRDAYVDYITKIAKLMGAEDENKTREGARAIMEMEIALANFTAPPEERTDDEKLYHAMTVGDLQKLAPVISWSEYFNQPFHKIGRNIKNDEVLVVYAPQFLANMSRIVAEKLKSEKGKIILNNYLVWHSVKALAGCLSKPFRDAEKALTKAILGSEGSDIKWRQCVSDTNNNLGFAVGAMFIKELFHEDTRSLAQDMVENIRSAFQNNLKNLKWMDEETRHLASEKAASITDMIGYPEFILHEAQLDEKYKNLTITEDDYFGNNIRVGQLSLLKNWQKLDKPVNKTRWGMMPPTVNAYYSPTSNQMVIPAGILQAPFFHPDFPPAVNYGGIGVVIGHEATHAFDDNGREYDKFGNLNQWWRSETIEKFKKQAECIINQYSSYKIGEHHVNGKQTLGENIADNGGLKASYNAYKNIGDKSLPLPGLNMTHDQLFFVSFAQVWCSSSLMETLVLQLQNDPHVLSSFRVRGTLSNLPEFSNVFNCPIDSPLNPKDKCTVW